MAKSRQKTEKRPPAKPPRRPGKRRSPRPRPRLAPPSRAKPAKAAKPLAAEDSLKELRRRLLEISDLNAAGSVLSWDQATYMPRGWRGRARAAGRDLAPPRAREVRRSGVRAARRCARAAGREPVRGRRQPDPVVRRDFDKAIKVPADYVARANALGSASYDAWTRARPANDFAAMVPYLEQTLELSREYASFFAPYDHIADPFIDDADEGMTTATVRTLFAALRRELVPIVRAIAEQPVADDSCLRQTFAEAGAARFRTLGRDADGLRPRTRPARQDPSSVLHQVRGRRRPHHHARARGRHRRRAVLDAARGRPRHVRAGRERGARRHAARLWRVGGRAREPVPAVGERGRAQPRVLGALLSGAATEISRSVRRRCRSTRSIAPSTRSSARSSAPTPTR